MAINRDMKKCVLQVKKRTRTKSGAWKESWEEVGKIQVAIYKVSESIYAASERYKDSTHTGLTHHRDISAGKFRILCGGKIYHILSCDIHHRLTCLLMKEVETDV